MSKSVVKLLIYQVGSAPGGPSAGPLVTPESFLIPFGARTTVHPTWIAGSPNNYLDPNVAPNIRYKVYSGIEVVKPSNSGVDIYYTNSTVDEINTLVNS